LNKQALYNFIDLKAGEEKKVGLFVAYSFFMGVAVAIFYTATTSMFLLSFDRVMLPKAYIAGGLTVYALGMATNYIEKKIRFTRLVNILIYFLMASVTGLLLAYQFSDVKWFIFFLFVWNRVFVYVNGITFWSTAAKIFNIQEAKRLFGLIGAGEVVSSILSYFSVPLLLKVLATDQLLYIVAISVLGCIVTMSLIIRNFTVRLTHTEAPAPTPDAPKDTRRWKDFLANRYYLLIFLLAMLPVAGLFFVDFMFSVESKNVFPDKELLASFLGVFFGFCALVEILIKTVLYGKAMNKYGLKLGITLLPLSLLFSTVLAVSYGAVYGATSLFFAFIVLSRFFMSSVRKSVNEPSFQVLLQPIPTPERAALQSRIEGGPKAIGNIVSGVVLLILTSYSFIGTIHIAALFVFVLVFWFYVSLLTHQKYRTVLTSLLKESQTRIARPAVPQGTSPEADTSSRNRALNYEYSNFEFIVKLTESPRVHDRLLATRLLEESGRYYAYRHIGRLINDESAEVKEAAIRAAGTLQKAELWPQLIDLLRTDRFHRPAAESLVRIGQPVIRELQRSFARSTGQTEFQLRIIRVIRQIGGDAAVRFFRSVIDHPQLLLRDEVFESLKLLRYRARITERAYIGSEIDSRIELLVWIMASQRDLEHYPPWSPVQVALEKEKKWVIPKIFTLFSLLNPEQHYDFICDMLVRENQETYGYLLEVLNMTLPEEWKNKVVILFEDRPLTEKLRLCADFYPNPPLSPESRLNDIVNKDFTLISRWLKVNALSELAQLAPNDALLFAAHAVSPDEIIAEKALGELLRLNPTRFHELVASMESHNDTFHLEIARRIERGQEEHDTLSHKVWVLSQIDRFLGYREDELIPLSCALERHSLTSGQRVDREALTRYEHAFWIVAVGEVLVQEADNPALRLGSFDIFERTSRPTDTFYIEVQSDTEIYCINGQKVARLRSIMQTSDALAAVSEPIP
jgi:ATP:ADP antiporter, AAA family